MKQALKGKYGVHKRFIGFRSPKCIAMRFRTVRKRMWQLNLNAQAKVRKEVLDYTAGF
jgi:hypothetical protein